MLKQNNNNNLNSMDWQPNLFSPWAVQIMGKDGRMAGSEIAICPRGPPNIYLFICTLLFLVNICTLI